MLYLLAISAAINGPAHPMETIPLANNPDFVEAALALKAVQI
jgi:hypothetical protein